MKRIGHHTRFRKDPLNQLLPALLEVDRHRPDLFPDGFRKALQKGFQRPKPIVRQKEGSRFSGQTQVTVIHGLSAKAVFVDA
ncbi:hypothetical protein K2M58_09120 [Hydrogenibacillus sp. N12]|nr:hypothetical protein K2M58_09120 [Hydrogenibacillus sp. N12]